MCKKYIHSTCHIVVLIYDTHWSSVIRYSLGTDIVTCTYAWLGDTGIVSSALLVITSSYTGSSQVGGGTVAMAVFCLWKMPYASFLGGGWTIQSACF